MTDTDPVRRHPLRILVADDSSINRRLAQALLGRLGYDPVLVSDGQEALDALKRQRFDLVLLDVHMPGVDGLEVARRVVAEFPDGRRPRLIALTADGGEEQRAATLEAGMEAHLAKPLTADGLAAVLAEAAPRAD